jgi:peptidylprolyl isomerase
MAANIRILLFSASVFFAAAAGAATRPGAAEVLAAAKPSDWRPLDPTETLYVELPAGRVVIELAPAFAPLHVANIKALARAKYFDGLSILRVQDNYVVQWGDPEKRHPVPSWLGKLAPEFDSPLPPHMAFTPLPDGDVYAPEVGFSGGFPVARSPQLGLTWLAHCYGMVGVGRDIDPQTGSGAEMYVVIGHAPRHLDRNVALVGRVVQGMELLSSLPRGSGDMGFYAKTEVPVRIDSIRVAADVAPTKRAKIEILRNDTATFAALVEARRNRPEDFFQVPAGHIELCNVPLAVRPGRELSGPHK